MATKIKISAGSEQQISALYSNPSEKKEQEKSAEDTNFPKKGQNADDDALFGSDRPIIIMAHGFPGHMASNNDLFGDLEFILAEKGYDTLRFDFRGCGKSDALAEDFTLERACEDFRHVLYWATQQGYNHFIYVGEGFGASVAVMNLVPQLNAAIFLWPIFDLSNYYKQHFANETFDSASKAQSYIEKEEQKYGMNFLKEIKKKDISDKIRELDVPALIMHGAQDQTVPLEHLDMVRELAGSKRIEITVFQDGEHGLQKLNHRKMIFYHITQFIEKYL